MPQSLAKLYVHFVFSTKDRRPFLENDKVRREAHAYISGICRKLKSPSLIVGGIADHVHLLCFLSRVLSVAEFVKEVKRVSSKWIKTKNLRLSAFQWQNGYGAFSISPSHVDALKEYIQNQEEHHRTESFQDEFRRLLKKYGIEYDERYVWG